MPRPRDLPVHLRERVAALAPDADAFAVALSGGGDSMALASLAREAGRAPTLLHVDHALRPDSAADAAFVAERAAAWSLPLLTTRIDVARIAPHRNVSAAARTARYAALTRMARSVGADALLVAHTSDDQAETVLLQALRGAAALRGMPERRGRVVRPLLGVTRDELRDHLRERGIPWRDDPGNDDPATARGWLRTVVLPAWQARYPGATARLARLASFQGDAADAVALAAGRLPRGGDGIDVAALARAPRAVARAAIAALLRDAGISVDAERIEDALRHLATPRWRRTLAPGVTWRIHADRLAVVRAPDPPAVRSVTRPTDLPPGVDPAILAEGPLTLRGPRPGDRALLGGRSRALADLWHDVGVPREERGGVKLLARGRDVLWAEGVVDFGPAGPTLAEDDDHRFMREALALARTAALEGEMPVGALIVMGGAIVGRGGNRTRQERDPTAHAEVNAIRAAARAIGDWRLVGATLVVTLEPCPMCLGASLAAHVERVVYGARNEREGALGGVVNVAAEGWKRRLQVRGGVRARAAGRLLTDFMARARSRDAGRRGGRLYDDVDEDPQLLDHRPRRSR